MLLLDKPFPPDIRVQKESSAMLNANYNVFLLTCKTKGQLSSENVKGIRVMRTNWPFALTPQKRILSYLFGYLILPLRLISVVLKCGIQVLHVHDLPYALLAALVGKICHRKIVLDMHEHYLALVQPVFSKNAFGRLLLFYLRLEEIISCKLSTKIIVVVEENAKRLNSLGVPSDKILVVSNTADIDLLSTLSSHFGKKKSPKEEFVISYMGGFSWHRGLDTFLKAIPSVTRADPKIHVLLVGDGEMKATLQKMVDATNINDYVTFTGWLPFDEALRCVYNSDLGIIPYHSTPHTNTTVPHKVFQFMYLKKPVLVSDVKPLKRVVETTKCGLVFRASDPVCLAEKILQATKNTQQLKKFGENGHTAVVEKYNWHQEREKLIGMYRDITKSGR